LKESFTKVDKDCDLENGVGIQMDKLYLIIVHVPMEEVELGSPNPRWKKEENTTISFVLGVGISSSTAWRHCSMARLG
jgi:hypothetical protein